VWLPERYRSLIESAYAHVGLEVGSAGAPAADERDPVVYSDDPKGGRGSIVVAAWNARAARDALRHLLARHVDVVHADLDLHTLVDPDEAVSTLNELGFFYAGVLLYGLEGHDYLRLQLLNAENIETEAIVCDSAFARDLLGAVLDDRARVGA
jgi:hypothetical protein